MKTPLIALCVAIGIAILLLSCSKSTEPQTCANPVFSKTSGTYNNELYVTISCETPGAVIRYTTNGSDPTESSNQYNSGITINASTTLKAKAFKSGWNPSTTTSASYTIIQTVATPVFSPEGGTYYPSVNVSISCSTPGATIRYTTNGSNPTSSSPIYSSPISITSTTTLKAKAFKSGWNESAIANSTYSIEMPQTVATPTFNPSGGTYNSTQSVTISCSTPGATIRYTTNGSTPTSSSPQYQNPVTISATTTLKARAFRSGWYNSEIASAVYTIDTTPTVATPTFNPPGGSYSSPQNVTISCSTSGATIRYTTNGSNPTSSSPTYTSPISVTSSTTIKAKAFKSGWTPSATASATYTITPSGTVATPTFNPAGGTYSTTQNVSISTTTPNATIRYTTNGSEPTSTSTIYSSPISVSSTTTIKAKGFRDGWTPSATASATYTIGGGTPGQMIAVAGGTFHNGTSNVTLSSFHIGKYEVTQAGYQAVMGSNPASGYGVGDTYPVYYVSWFNAIEYCNRRSMQEGLTPCYSYSSYGTNPDDWPAGWNSSNGNHTNVSCNWSANGYRLPTEMEWMYAAKGGNQSQGYTYSGSNDLNAVGWYWDNWGASALSTHTVGALAANELGTFDMSGNVWEWVWDIYGNYPSGNQTDPTGPTSGSDRVLRGGDWVDIADYCTVSNRFSHYATSTSYSVGFRVIRVSP